IRDFHVTGVQTCALPIFLGFYTEYTYLVFSIFLPIFSPLFKKRFYCCFNENCLISMHHLDGNWKQQTVERIQRGDKAAFDLVYRSEERRVGKECRCWWVV